jgi:DNA replication protein DnaC
MQCVKEEEAQRHLDECGRNTEDSRLQEQQRLEDAGIPIRWKNHTFKNYEASTAGQVNALREARHFAERFTEACKTGKSMLFVGSVGTGKTHLAVAIAQHVVALKRTVRYVTFGKFMQRIKESWGPLATEKTSQVTACYTEPDLLIVDEVGVQYGSDAERNVTFEVINDRYNALKPTVLISNLEMEALKVLIGERILDRMRESGGKAVMFNWHSHRRGRM